MNRIFPLILCIAFLSSCDGCKQGEGSASLELDSISIAKESVAANASKENISKVLGDLSTQIVDSKDKTTKKKLLEAGYQIAKENNQKGQAITYLVTLLKEYPSAAENKDYLFFIGENMMNSKNRQAAELILTGFIKNFPNDPRIEAAKKLIQNPILDKDAYIQKMAEAVFENPDKFGINRVNAQKYVDICEAHALAYPNDKNTPVYLYRAAEIAVAIRTFTKALTIYDWLIDFYPDYEKSPNALFAKGYLMEEELDKPERARQAFTQFMEAYPTHELADDAKFLLENIGKSGDEIIKIIEENKKNLPQ